MFTTRHIAALAAAVIAGALLTLPTAMAGHADAARAIGDFDFDGFDDLAVGVPADQPGAVDPGGEVNVFYGGNRTSSSRRRSARPPSPVTGSPSVWPRATTTRATRPT